MTSYASAAQLVQLSISAVAIASISVPDQQACLDAVSVEFDGFLAAQYTLPLVAWGTSLAQHVCDVAAYRLIARRGFFSQGTDQVLRDRERDAWAWAKGIAQGVISPPDIIDSTPNLREGAPSVITGLLGNTVGGTSSPTMQQAGAKPYPYTNVVPGRRGW